MGTEDICKELAEITMNINGRWYTETEAQAYIITLEHKNATLEEKHLSECRQISEYDHELRQAKRLLKAAVEDFREINSDILTCKYCKWYSTETGECAYCPDDVPCEQICGWKHADEALALIGGELDGV